MGIKLIIFDLDGVIVETKELHYTSLNDSLEDKYKISWDEHLTKYDGLKTNQKLSLLSKDKGLPIESHSLIWEKKQKITFGIFKAVEPLVDVFMDLAMKALPYVSDAVSMVYSGMMAYFTFLKEAGGGAIQILKGVFTLDGDAISAGIDKVSGSFGKATNTYKKSMKAFGEGEKELTDSEKEALEKKKELLEKQKEAREKAQADAEAKRQKEIEDQKAFNKEIADLEKSKYEQLRDIQAKSEQEKLDLQAQRDLEEILALQKKGCLLYTSPSPRDRQKSRMPSSA